MPNDEPVLYLKHRPTDWDGMIGQAEAVSLLRGKLKDGKLPRALMLTGEPGTGKTTAARILRRQLGCGKSDYCEINCAAIDEPLKAVRRIQQHVSLAPSSGKCRVWCLDEVQALSRAGFAQQALLKTLEDTPKHVYFILCTTDPAKIIKAIQSRCTIVRMKPLGVKELSKLINDVALKEGHQLLPEVYARIAEAADGSARKALVILDQIRHLKTEQEQLDAVVKSDAKDVAFQIAKALVWGQGRTNWGEIAKLIESVEEEPETIRRLVLACASKEVLKGGKGAANAYLILTAFESHWYDSGRNGLVRAAWEVFSQK